MRIIVIVCFCFFIPIFISQAQTFQEDDDGNFQEERKLSQSNVLEYIIIQDIIIRGNSKTKKHIILRELDVAVGDTVLRERVDTVLQRNKNKIFNTNLFVTVDLSLKKSTGILTQLSIDLEERWYFFPGPIFELSDRNFNEWWNTYNADLSRTNYGMRLVIENFRGRGEKLDILTQFGFTKKFGVTYKIPYIDRKQKHGINFGISYAQNRSIAYRTLDHQLDFLDSAKSILREKFETNLSLTKRNGFYDFHTFDIGYKDTYIADTILTLNPRYLLTDDNRQQYFRFSYEYSKDLRDIAAYPLEGSLLRLKFEKRGLGIFHDLNRTEVSAAYVKYQALSKKFFIENQISGLYSFQPQQPYYDAKAVGYSGNTLRGYELYVIDGQSFVLNKNTLKFQLLNVKTHMNFLPIKQFRTVPFAMYLTGYVDTGYVSDKYFSETNQRFSNKFIYGWGFGVDAVTFYNLVIKFNYSFNSDLEGGFFLNFSTDI